MHAVALTPDGKYLWDIVLGSTDIDAFNGIAVNKAGAIVAGGDSRSNFDLGGAGSHTNAGSFDGVVVYVR
jgi:hypothetical protein